MRGQSRVWVLAGFIACLATAAVAADGCPTSKDAIATDRPDTTNSSLVVPTGSFQSENGINLSGRNGATIFDGTNSRLRLGIAPCVEVLVDVPTYFAVLSGEESLGLPTSRRRSNGRSVPYREKGHNRRCGEVIAG